MFSRFLYEHERVTDSTMDIYLNGIDFNKIVESVEFYLSTGNVRFEDTVRVYVSAISELIRYLYATGIISKSPLIESMGVSKDNIFSKNVNTLINNLIVNKKLKYPSTKQPISSDEFIKLVEGCNKVFSETNLIKKAMDNINKYNGGYTKIVSSLMLKFILTFGLKISELYRIKLSDIDIKHNTFKHNGYVVNIPDTLYDQIQIYLEVRNSIDMEDNQNLFIDYNGKSIVDNTGVDAFIKQIIKKVSTTKISKYVIMKLFQNNIPRIVIKEFTGHKNDILDYCQDKVYELQNINKIKILKSKLHMLDYYDIL